MCELVISSMQGESVGFGGKGCDTWRIEIGRCGWG